MKERAILFSAPMVRAILEGRKTQTRRVMKPAPLPARDSDGQEWWLVDFESEDRGYGWKVGAPPFWTNCPYGVPGDRLWVRETWGIADSGGRLVDPCINYRADGGQLPLIGHADPEAWSIAGNVHEVNDADLLKVKDGWRSSRFMFRWASRITLEIVDVRVQRVQEMSNGDAVAEGVTDASGGSIAADGLPRLAFRHLWNSINAKRGFGWDVNPWVWALTFKRVA